MIDDLPSFQNYMGTNRDNALVFDMGDIVVWFSYHTPIAFSENGRFDIIVRENEWGPTTGKHLNAIARNKASRIPGAEFEERLREALNKE